MRLTPVPVSALPQAWPIVAPWLERACARPGPHGVTVGSLLEACQREQALLVLIGFPGAPVAAVVTQVIQQGTDLSCWILALGGAGARAWRGLLSEIEEGARRVGCRTVEFVGRRQWACLYPDYTAVPVAAGTHFLKPLVP
ncbi:hypothetical protein PUR29_36545 [Methylobacterium ajmalii]|uniref:Uncharacterized protein n=1 Tax=Methylobacterium ajmalii TaxID=2738439 RepID=A0ABV0A547_9HYPH